MNQKGWLVALLALLLGGVGGWWFLCRDHGGHGSGAPKFRRIRFINVSGNEVTKFKVSRVLPAPAAPLWPLVDTPVKKDGDQLSQGTPTDWIALDRAMNDMLANSTKVSVEISVQVGGAEKALAAVEMTTDASNQLFTELVIVLDNHWDTVGHANDFQVTLLGTWCDTDEGAATTKDVQVTLTPPP